VASVASFLIWQELIEAEALTLFGAHSARFHSAGREDAGAAPRTNPCARSEARYAPPRSPSVASRHYGSSTTTPRVALLGLPVSASSRRCIVHPFSTSFLRGQVDVRMLGNGRPFVLELLEPRTPDQPPAACVIRPNLAAALHRIRMSQCRHMSQCHRYAALAEAIGRNSGGKVGVRAVHAALLPALPASDESAQALPSTTHSYLHRAACVQVSGLTACTASTIQSLDQSKTEDAHHKDYRCVVKVRHVTTL
jgi:hypothetical protein